MIYPDNPGEMKAKGYSDQDLANILEIVNLNHIVTREGGWDTTADWKVISVLALIPIDGPKQPTPIISKLNPASSKLYEILSDPKLIVTFHP